MCRKIFILILLIVLILTFMVVGGLFVPSSAEAQYWQALPPYNVLWPLWSEVWSPLVGPPDPITLLPTPVPLLSELTSSTILPFQPALAWDPTQPAPWLLYNTPPTVGSGLLFFDQAYGLNAWPPPYLQDSVTGLPSPITYVTSYSFLAPTTEIPYLVPLGNATYALTFGITAPAFNSLLSAADIWGLPPIVPF